MKLKQRGVPTGLCAAVLALTLLLPAAAAEPVTAHVALWRNEIYVDGVFAGFQNEQGRPVDAIFSYNGTVYIPIRTAGAWMGCSVAWDQSAQAIRLTSGGSPAVTPSSELPDSTQEELDQLSAQIRDGVTITIRPDITVYLDGQAQSFTNVKGEPVYPAALDGVTYLPVRNVGEMCGLEVLWTPSPEEIHLYAPLTDAQKAELIAYDGTLQTAYSGLKEAVAKYTASVDLDAGAARELLHAMRDHLKELQATVTVPMLQQRQRALSLVAQSMLDDPIYTDLDHLDWGVAFNALDSKVLYQQRMVSLGGAVDGIHQMLADMGLL